MKEKKPSENYLDFIPRKNVSLKWEQDEKGSITLFVENRGFFNGIAQKFFKRPKFTQVHLDEMGNFIWPLVNGENSVYDISIQVKEHFGEKAEPLYQRLVSYMKTLESYEFISMIKKSTGQ